MKLPLAILLATLLSTCGPPVVLPECPQGTVPYVCHQIGVAECTDGLNVVAGCYVQATPSVRLECVRSCG